MSASGITALVKSNVDEIMILTVHRGWDRHRPCGSSIDVAKCERK